MDDPNRYHLLHSVDGRPVAHGWWASESTARSKFRTWVGTWGLPGARITLVDEETGTVLEAWPEKS